MLTGFLSTLYDKRDAFPFHIVRMPDNNGNIPTNIFYGSILSEFLRTARSTLLFEEFFIRIKLLITRMINQGGDKKKILGQFNKAIRRHPEPFKKYSISPQDIINKFNNSL